MTYTHCQNCGGDMVSADTQVCIICGWTPGLNWHRDQPSGWTPERAKACYDACQDVPTEFLTQGYVKRLLDAYDALQLKVDVRERREIR